MVAIATREAYVVLIFMYNTWIELMDGQCSCDRRAAGSGEAITIFGHANADFLVFINYGL